MVSPVDVLRQIAHHGINYPLRFKWYKEPLPWLYEISPTFALQLLAVLREILRLGLAFLPWMTVDIRTSWRGTFFCYFVFVFALYVPNTSVPLMMASVKIVRDELFDQARCIRMMQSMLAAPRKWEMLPRVRYNVRSDLLAWFELYEYIEETHRTTFHFVLAQVGVIGLLVYVTVLILVLFALTVFDIENSRNHVSFLALVLWTLPFMAVATLSTISAGIHLNNERARLMKQLSLLIMCQQKCFEQTQSCCDQPRDFEAAMSFTLHCVERMEVMAKGNSKVLGMRIDVKTAFAVVMAGCSMLGYVFNTSNLAIAFKKEFCSLRSHLVGVDMFLNTCKSEFD